MKFKTFKEKLMFKSLGLTKTGNYNREPFILIEGVDCSGKSTIAENLKNIILTNFNKEYKIYHEPTELNNLNELILSEKFNNFDQNNIFNSLNNDYIRYFLFMAARSVTLGNIFNDIKNKGVILDRSYPSTMVYQRRLDIENNIHIFNQNVELYKNLAKSYGLENDFKSPDIIIFLEINPATSVLRLKDRLKTDLLDASSIKEVENRIQHYSDVCDYIENTTDSLVLRVNGESTSYEIAEEIILKIKHYMDW